MNFENGFETVDRTPHYGSVTGKIVEMLPHGGNGLSDNGCNWLFMVEEENGAITNFVVNTNTYVVDFETLDVGMNCTFWFPLNAPALLIYPPQYTAAVAAPVKDDRRVEVAYFDEELLNDKKNLRLNLEENQVVYTTNNQKFSGRPGGHDLVVEYTFTTRSIPAQTTPMKVVVLHQSI